MLPTGRSAAGNHMHSAVVAVLYCRMRVHETAVILHGNQLRKPPLLLLFCTTKPVATSIHVPAMTLRVQQHLSMMLSQHH